MRVIVRPAQLFKIADRLRTSFWFLPSGMAAVGIAVATGLVWLDRSLSGPSVQKLSWLYEFGPEGARAILAAVATSMITVAGLTFSITMLTLQLASSQYGPRILRNFMRDRGNQTVLGTFIGTFVYCLLVLRTVRGVEGSAFVPHVSVAFGLFLAIASLAVLIYFIHHVANSIRIETLLAKLTSEALATVEVLYPEQIGEAPAFEHTKLDAVIPADFETESCPVKSRRSGYVQRIDEQALINAAEKADLFVQLNRKPGDFVRSGEALMSAYPRERMCSSTTSDLHEAIVLGQERTPDQDVAFALRRIVEIAQRALSPGVNDPTTALYCLDRLHEILAELAQRRVPAPIRLDKEGRPRVVAQSLCFADLTCRTLTAIARYGARDADVLRALRKTTESIIQVSPASSVPKIAEFLDSLAVKVENIAQQGQDRVGAV